MIDARVVIVNFCSKEQDALWHFGTVTARGISHNRGVEEWWSTQDMGRPISVDIYVKVSSVALGTESYIADGQGGDGNYK